MEQRQFIELMESKGSLSKETLPMLQDFVSRFPYCQTGHLLLAKCLHDQQNIHFDQQLKTAAVYAADRKILYNLIQGQTEKTKKEEAPVFKETPLVNMEPVVKEQPVVSFTQNIFREEEKIIPETKPEADNTFKRALTSEENAFEEFSLAAEIKETVKPVPEPPPLPEEPSVQEQFFREWYSEEEILGEAVEEKPAALMDPHEVIKRRLSEILGKNDDTFSKSESADSKKDLKKDDIISEKNYIDSKADFIKKLEATEKVVEKTSAAPSPGKIRQEIISPVESPVAEKESEEEIIASQVGKVHDVIDRIGLEHAMEETILHSLEKLPVIHEEKEVAEVPVAPAESSLGETHSFFAWLKMNSGGEFGKVEEIHADEEQAEIQNEFDGEDEENRKASSSKEDLINQFIATEPRIVPSKAEFYSPVNQAKKSIAEHEDLISETLAKIYFDQGNLLKARSGYERLCLLHPEKSSYFAALIQDIDNLINKQE